MAAALKVFDVHPGTMTKDPDFFMPMCGTSACYEHFGGGDPDFARERTDKVEALKEAL